MARLLFKLFLDIFKQVLVHSPNIFQHWLHSLRTGQALHFDVIFPCTTDVT